MLDIVYSNQAGTFLKKSDNVLARRLLKKIECLGNELITHDTKILDGYKEKLFRVRVGDYRILYEINNKSNMLGIVKIDKRSRAYE